MRTENWQDEKRKTRERRDAVRRKQDHEHVQSIARMHLKPVNKEDEIRALCAYIAYLEN